MNTGRITGGLLLVLVITVFFSAHLTGCSGGSGSIAIWALDSEGSEDPTPSIPADGITYTTLEARVTVAGADGALCEDGVVGTRIKFTTTRGQFIGGGTTTKSTTNVCGTAYAYLVALEGTTPGNVTVTASSDAAVNSASVTVLIYSPEEYYHTITLAAEPTSIKADGIDTSTLTATVTDSDGKPVAGTTVKFTTTLGEFVGGGTSTTTTTDTNGEAHAYLIAQEGTAAGIAIITAISDYSVNSATAAVGIGTEGAGITLSADPTSIPADGITFSTLTATVKDSAGDAVVGSEVIFTTNKGLFSDGHTGTTATTDSNGVALAYLYAPVGTANGIATVIAHSPDATGAATAAVTIGGGSTASIELSADDPDTNGISKITATLKDSAGNLLVGKTATFTTDEDTFTNGGNVIFQTTDAAGQAIVYLDLTHVGDIAHVTCTADGVTATIAVSWTS
jgi:hypothetical protein